jgi:hypothetical protein
MRAGVAQGGIVSPVLFGMYVNDMRMPSRHVQSVLYAEDMTIISTSRKSALLIRYLQTYLSDLERWLREWRIAINVSKTNAMLFAKEAWRFPRPRPVQFLGEQIEWFDTARYFGVTLDARLTWRPYFVQVRKKAYNRLRVIGSLLNRRSGLSIRNGVLLNKELIRPMMDYACPIWRWAAHSYIKKLQILQSKCFRIATGARCYISDRQIHEDIGLPFFDEYTRTPTVSYDSKLADVGNPLVWQLGRYLR